jgi:hypothetical protein
MLSRLGADDLEEGPLVGGEPVAEDAIPFAVEHRLSVLDAGERRFLTGAAHGV